MLFWRLYESAEIRLIRKHMTGCSTIIDLGASLGFAAAHALSRMSPTGLFVAVEPNERLIASLRQTLDSHANGRRVQFVCAAISHPDDVSVTLLLSDNSTASHIGEGGEIVQATSLSDIVIAHRLEKFALISDIEGAEASVIFDDPALDRCERMVIELHDSVYLGRAVRVADLYDRLLSRGFAVLEQQGPVVALARHPPL